MYELKKIGKLFTFVGTGPSTYEKGIYRAAVSQRLRNTALESLCLPPKTTANSSDSEVPFSVDDKKNSSFEGTRPVS
jgi:hypothetical protein